MSSLAPLRLRALTRILQANRGWQLLLALLVGVVCYLAFTPTPPQLATAWWDKANHSLAFLALTFTACLAFPRPGRGVWLVIVGLLAFGAGIEVVQAFVPGRSCEWADLLADSVGIAAGVLVTLPLRSAVTSRR
ncbi:VanZ family protein [Piscinibacter gummiphilus]|uniref:VanZ family protein n=1 Tax=Piscinibacter gummiphilus TaxID=946333 RepID=A0ABZ0CY75_9BURK|nr:VanZ family protein [Piscinibacter gummiphilus]WOB09910.1 VanZ family protein [Piscinibacter gummiphilus]